jgi:hypothetical protein
MIDNSYYVSCYDVTKRPTFARVEFYNHLQDFTVNSPVFNFLQFTEISLKHATHILKSISI